MHFSSSTVLKNVKDGGQKNQPKLCFHAKNSTSCKSWLLVGMLEIPWCSHTAVDTYNVDKILFNLMFFDDFCLFSSLLNTDGSDM